MKGSEEVYINMRPLCPGPNSGEGGGGAEGRRRKEIERSREREEEQKRKGREGSRAWRERMRRRGFCSVTQGYPPKCHPPHPGYAPDAPSRFEKGWHDNVKSTFFR